MRNPEQQTMIPFNVRKQMEAIYHAWDDAIERNDISALVNLYAPDAEIESPLIHEFTDSKTGLLRGRDAFRTLYAEVARPRSDVIRPRHHDDYFTDGRRIIWEYPRLMADGEHSEFVESWDFNAEFLILRHRVYWGWSRIAALRGKGFARPGGQ